MKVERSEGLRRPSPSAQICEPTARIAASAQTNTLNVLLVLIMYLLIATYECGINGLDS